MWPELSDTYSYISQAITYSMKLRCHIHMLSWIKNRLLANIDTHLRLFFGKIIEYARKHYKSYIERVQPKHLRPQNLIFENLQMYRGGVWWGTKVELDTF